MITEIPGIEVGHWTDAAAQTGCTVVLLPEGTVASGEVRGGAPAEREMALLDPTRLVERLDALVLTGGSAFGLASADGVMRWCEAEGRGLPTAGGLVPIVVALGLYDLDVGDGTVRPGPHEGEHACRDATADTPVTGQIGAGTGARTFRLLAQAGLEPPSGGLVSATSRQGDLIVSCLLAVNAVGQAGGDHREAPELAAQAAAAAEEARPSVLGNTTIGLVATNARLDKVGCLLMAQSAHDGLALGLFPAHTRFDGDAIVAAATGTLGSSTGAVGDSGALVDIVRWLTVDATARALTSLATTGLSAPES